MSDLIINNSTSINLPTFKSPALAEKAATCARILNGLANSTRLAANDVARILCEIDAGELYKDDGYKSTADFAEKALSLKKSTVSTLLGAGKRFLQSDSNNPLPKQTAYNLYYLKDFSDSDIQNAVDKGEITNASTQADIKKWADEHSAQKSTADTDNKPKVVPMYKVTFRIGNVIKVLDETIAESDIQKAVLESASVTSANNEYVKLSPLKLADGNKVNRALIIVDDGRDIFGTILVYYKMVKAPKTAKPKAKTANFTVAELEAMLAAAKRAAVAETADKESAVASVLSKK